MRAGTIGRTGLVLAVAALTLGAAGCLAGETRPPETAQPVTPAPTPPPAASPAATATATPTTPATPEATPTAAASPASREPLDEEGVAELLRRAVCWYDDPGRAVNCVPPTEGSARAIADLGLSGDPRVVAPLVDMLWLEVGWARWVEEALETLTGQRLPDARSWSVWVARESPPLPEAYQEWKGRLLSIVDPRFATALSRGRAHEPRIEELLWTSVRLGGLPPLEEPATVHRVEERYLEGDDVVFGLQLGGESRAYPERIVAWHGAVHDQVGGRSVMLLHCLPCGSAAAFETEVAGRERRLVASGLVYRSRMLFADEESGSLWDPVSGRALTGPAYEAGERLIPLPLRRATWEAWSEAHAATRVLSLETGFLRDYDPRAALEADDASEEPLYPAEPVDGRLPPTERVRGIETTAGGSRAAHALPLAGAEEAGIATLSVGGASLVLLSRGPGSGVAAYHAPPEPIERLVMTDALGLLAVDSEEQRWFVSEEGLVSTLDGARLASVPTRTAYWFAWAAAMPESGLSGD